MASSSTWSGRASCSMGSTRRHGFAAPRHSSRCWPGRPRSSILSRSPPAPPSSYASTWRAPGGALIAPRPIGSAEGYNRRYSNRAQVLVRGRRAPVVGRVCMDMSMVDVTDVPGVSVGDEVVLLGSQGAERITAEELADLAQTVHYEVICAVGARVPRVVR